VGNDPRSIIISIPDIIELGGENGGK
jgi:hypothetical protein